MRGRDGSVIKPLSIMINGKFPGKSEMFFLRLRLLKDAICDGYPYKMLSASSREALMEVLRLFGAQICQRDIVGKPIRISLPYKSITVSLETC